MSKEEPYPKCPLCDAPADHVLTECLRRGEGTVSYCESCDHGFLVPKEKKDITKYYADGYRNEFSHHASGVATNAREIFDIYKKYQTERVTLISPYLSRESTVLEVGASSGQFLVNIQEKVASVHAVELDISCCDFMNTELGIDADSKLLHESKFAKNKYDTVCAFQVMEHVENPASFLLDIMSSLKDGGVAFIEVPNLRDPLLSVWNINSYQSFYYHSAHLQYFTEKSLRKVAMDAGCLPNQVDVKFTQDYNLLNHLNWITNDCPQPTCDVGLSPIKVQGKDQDISDWLTGRLKELNDEYIAKLVHAKATSNMMMILKKSGNND